MGRNKCVDIGAGIGTLSEIFRSKYQIQPTCVEIDDDNIGYLKKRNFESYRSIDEVPFAPDLIFSSNVLEHIEDDAATLATLTQKLSPGGMLFLYLPAHRLLWSTMDETVGHYRSYSHRELVQKIQVAGLQVHRCHFADCLGFFASILIKLIGYKSGEGLATAGSLKFYDKVIFPISKILDSMGMRYIIGKNLVVIAHKI